MPADLDIIVVVPAYNEEKTLPVLVSQIKQLTRHIVVVDDGSTDGTSTVARRGGAVVVRLTKNQGKGRAARLGLWYAVVRYQPRQPLVAIMDADRQHSPLDLPSLVKVQRQTEADVVVGRRILVDGDGPLPTYFRQRYVVNHLTSKFIRIVYRLPTTDLHSGYRLYKRTSLERLLLGLRSRKFELETEVLLEAWAWGQQVAEVPVRLIYPPEEEYSSNIRPLDGWRWFWLVLRRMIDWRYYTNRRRCLSQATTQRRSEFREPSEKF